MWTVLAWLLALALLPACDSARDSLETAQEDGFSELGRPNIVLVMTDDQGWGQAGYYGHPVLETPHLDAMAAAGLRLDRFYAGAPNCSPTRATVLTGRSNDRTGVFDHGHALRLQEKVLPQALRDAGYATGHFGKWHLNGYIGPGVPILADDPHHPGHFGFDEWLSVTNFFDRDPMMSRGDRWQQMTGDSSEVVVAEALDFMNRQAAAGRPFFAVIWYGSPHSPWLATEADRAPFGDLSEESQHHYGELRAMDRSLGTLRSGLGEIGVAGNTLLWFNSDNGGLPRVTPDTVGGLRGFKNSLYEGGLRVPAVIEWPGTIEPGRVSAYPASTVDVFPTLAAIAGLPESTWLEPQDGRSLLPLFAEDLDRRDEPLGFRHTGRGAWIDNRWKLVATDLETESFELYDLARDAEESTDLFEREPEVAGRLVAALREWNASVERSALGADYPEGQVSPDHPGPRIWMTHPDYEPYIEQFYERSEYRGRIDRARARPRAGG